VSERAPTAVELLEQGAGLLERQAPATVYVARTASGIVLYVGITGSRIRRMHAHAKASEWWRKAASIELIHVGTRAEAEALEASLIRELAARFNVQHGRRAPGIAPVELEPDLLDLDGVRATGLPLCVAKIVLRDLPHERRGRRKYVRRQDVLRWVKEHTRVCPPGQRP
jgi:hypothetical protein